MKSVKVLFAWWAVGAFLSVQVFGGLSGKPIITLQEAIGLVQKHNPSLHAVREKHEAAKKRLVQLSSFSNPQVELEAENLNASGDYDEGVKYSARIKKNFQFWGRYRNEVALARADTSYSYFSREIRRLAVDNKAKTAYLEVWLAQEGLILALRNDSISREAHEQARSRVKAGKVPPLDSIRTGMRSLKADLNLDQARNQLNEALLRMENLWGGSKTKSMGMAEALPVPPSVLPVQLWQKRLAQSPRWKLAELKARRLQLNIALEKAARLPGFEISAGVKALESGNGHAWTGELSVPLPLLNWNSSNIASAQKEWKAGKSFLKASQLEMEEQLLKQHAKAVLFEKEYTATKEELLPAARRAYSATLEGYKAGKYSGQLLLDAGREWLEVEQEFLKITRKYHRAITDLVEISGKWPKEE